MATPVRPTRIAICIDDFALHAGVDEAAIALVSQGRVTAISCMVGAPLWRTHAPSLAGLDSQRIDVGLHLDLTEHPLDSASRRPLPLLVALSGARLIDRARLRAEIHAQLDAFEQGLARPPAHVDGHQHVHQFPVIREVLIDALVQRYPRQRPWLRRTKRPAATSSAGIKPWLIERLGCDRLTELAREQGFGQNTHLLGVYDFQGGAGRYLALLAQWLAAAQDSDVLMCHAATRAAAQDPIGRARGQEYQILSGSGFADLLERASVALGPLSRMHESYAASG